MPTSKRINTRIHIIDLIENGIETFLSGGMGNFDWLSANILYHLKEKYPKINNILVIPYLNFNIRNKKIFDEIIYPEGFEKYHFKAAIIKRNQYLAEQHLMLYVMLITDGAVPQKLMSMLKSAD